VLGWAREPHPIAAAVGFVCTFGFVMPVHGARDDLAA
jgi:hypothetical protein